MDEINTIKQGGYTIDATIRKKPVLPGSQNTTLPPVRQLGSGSNSRRAVSLPRGSNQPGVTKAGAPYNKYKTRISDNEYSSGEYNPHPNPYNSHLSSAASNREKKLLNMKQASKASDLYKSGKPPTKPSSSSNYMRINEIYKGYGPNGRPDTTDKLVELNRTLLNFEKRDSKPEISKMNRDRSQDKSIDDEILDLKH